MVEAKHNSMTIAGIRLPVFQPNQPISVIDEEVSAALGLVGQLVVSLARTLAMPLRYRIKLESSRSSIEVTGLTIHDCHTPPTCDHKRRRPQYHHTPPRITTHPRRHRCRHHHTPPLITTYRRGHHCHHCHHHRRHRHRRYRSATAATARFATAVASSPSPFAATPPRRRPCVMPRRPTPAHATIYRCRAARTPGHPTPPCCRRPPRRCAAHANLRPPSRPYAQTAPTLHPATPHASHKSTHMSHAYTVQPDPTAFALKKPLSQGSWACLIIPCITPTGHFAQPSPTCLLIRISPMRVFLLTPLVCLHDPLSSLLPTLHRSALWCSHFM